jgi:DNA-binding NtrC family response regulator
LERRILIVDDEEIIRLGLRANLELDGWNVFEASSFVEGIRATAEIHPDVVLAYLVLDERSGLELLEQIKSYDETITVVMMSGVGTIDIAVQALKRGAESFLSKPFDSSQLNLVLEQAAAVSASKRQLEALRRHADKSTTFPGISANARRVDEWIRSVADAPSPVLIEGESGSGKGVVARLIHDHSRRSSQPFVDLNCAGLSAELLESELFGHERGAFTGAVNSKPGLLEIASGGTMFLDEIGELEPKLQARLLKAIEEKRFRRVGGVREMTSDFRLIAATNRKLEEQVERGAFREDLYYRLNVLRIDVPSLRERREDIPLLVNILLHSLAPELGVRDPQISDRALEKLTAYHWPGNVRELRNTLERALLKARGAPIHAEQIELPAASNRASKTQNETIVPLDEVIAAAIRRAVELSDGNMREAARKLQISPSTLYARMKGGRSTAPESPGPKTDL